MKHANNIWKRLLSLALALVLVLGYMPTDVFATENVVDASALLTATVVSTPVPAAVETDDTESIEIEATEYQHVVTVLDKDGNNVTDQAVITGIDASKETVTVTVTYNGLVLKVASGETKTWTAKASWDKVTAGSKLAAPAIAAGELDGAAWSTVIKVVKGADGKDLEEPKVLEVESVIPASLIGCTLAATQTLKFEDAVLKVLDSTIKVDYADATYSCDHGAGWYAEMPDVTVKAATAVTDSACLVPVKVKTGDTVEVMEWVAAEGGFVCTIPAGEAMDKTVSFNGQEIRLQVDKVAPTVNSISAVARNEGTSLSVGYSVGGSAGKLIISDGTRTVEYAVDAAQKTFEDEVPVKFAGTVNVKVVNGVGKESAPVYGNVHRLPNVKAQSGIAGKKEGVTYVANDGKIVFRVDHCLTEPVWDVKAQEGEFTHTIDNENKTVTVVISTPVKGLAVCVNDGTHRDHQLVLDYVDFDKTAPVVNLTSGTLNEKKVITADDTLTYTLEVTDDVAIDSARSTAFFHIDGQDVVEVKFDAEGKASYQVKNGEYLKEIHYTVYDAAGNKTVSSAAGLVTNVEVDTTKPVIEVVDFSISANPNQVDAASRYVKFKTANKPVTAKLTVKLVEKNPDAEALNASGVWKLVDNEWVATVSAKIAAKKDGVLSLTKLKVTDLAGNKPANDIVVTIRTKGGASCDIAFSPKDGVYSSGLTINNANPNAKGPAAVMRLKIEGTAAETLDGIPVFKDSVVVGVTGVASVVSGATNPDVGTVTIDGMKVNFATDAGVENTYVTLGVTGVTAQGAETSDDVTFAVDTRGPAVSVKVKSNSTPTVANGIASYGKPVELVFRMDDMLSATAVVTYVVDEVTHELTLERGKKESIVLEIGQKLTDLTVKAVDALGNESSTFADYQFMPIYVDNEPPKLSLKVYEVVDGKRVEATPIEGENHYGNELVVVATAKDDFPGTATLTYVRNDNQETISFEPKGGTWSTEFTVKDGDKITGIALSAVDAANNYGERKLDATLIVDMTKPVIEAAQLTVPQEVMKNSFDGKDYYNGEVTYTFTLRDKFLNVKNTKVTVYYEGSEVGKDLEIKYNESEGVYEATVTIVNGETVTGYEVIANDHIKNHTVDVKDTTVIVVDTQAPTASLSVTAKDADKGTQLDIEKYYSRTVGEKLYYFAKLANPVKGEEADIEKAIITLTITVNDANLTTDDNETGFNVNGEGVSPVKTGKTVTYTKSIPVEADATGTIEIDLTAHDLAGNPLTGTLGATAKNGTNLQLNADDGKVFANLVVDRRRPSAGKDDDVPEIEITMPEVENSLKSSAGMDLYTSEIQIGIKVKDGNSASETDAENENLANNSGLQRVYYSITDHHKEYLDTNEDINLHIVEEDSIESIFGNPTMEIKKAITVGAGTGETNHATLTVVAIDNMGNAISKSVEFAIDKQAPRVVKDYNIDAGKLENYPNYFNEKRYLTLTVTDINLSPIVDGKIAEIAIDTSGTIGKWDAETDENGEYTCKVAFENESQKHYFSMVLNDLTGQHETSVARDDFIIDWTKPVINVSFSPATHSGVDPLNVLHYNEVVKVAVDFNEVNFDSKLVTPVGIQLSYIGDTAHSEFVEGNNYQFTIDCVDKAGNEAQPAYSSPTFSVDLTAPTITMTKGDLVLTEMNVIQDELVLAFTINDAQQNLDHWDVNLSRMNSNTKFMQDPVPEDPKYYTVTTQEERTTVLVNFASIEELKENDGIYTLQITARDYAGNVVNLTPELVMSFNRFGSTFYTDDDYTINFLKTGKDGNVYHNSIDQELIIKEINPNRVWQDSSRKVEGSVLTVAVNGTATQLTPGKEYEMTPERMGTGKNSWNLYTYEIAPDAFMSGGEIVDGRYSILIYGEDEAGNKNTNESNVGGALQSNGEGLASGHIEFVLDTNAPIITTTGIESGETYNADSQKLDIYLSDNTPVDIKIYLNGEEISPAESADGQANSKIKAVYDADIGAYTVDVPELSEKQHVKVVATDAAGNTAEYEINNFLISTNLFVRLLNNSLFIGGSVLALLLALALIILKKKKGMTQSV